MIGTIINAAAIVAGASLGLLLKSRLPKRIAEIVFQALGLFTLFIGISMALKVNQMLFVVFSLVIGGIIGEWLNLELQLNRFSNRLKQMVKSDNSKFTEGLVTSFLLFCMGSMTILGAFEEGAGGEPNLLLAKSVMDGFASVALAAAMGVGVLLSVVPLLIYQGSLTIFAGYLGQVLSESAISELTAVGGILLIGLGINILEIKKLRILNLIPSLIIIVLMVILSEKYDFINFLN